MYIYIYDIWDMESVWDSLSLYILCKLRGKLCINISISIYCKDVEHGMWCHSHHHLNENIESFMEIKYKHIGTMNNYEV